MLDAGNLNLRYASGESQRQGNLNGFLFKLAMFNKDGDDLSPTQKVEDDEEQKKLAYMQMSLE